MKHDPIQAGSRFGAWTVHETDRDKIRCNGLPYKTKTVYYSCRCDCGTAKPVSSRALKNGSSKSCGCIRNQQTRKRSKPLYVIAAEAHYASYKRNSSTEKRRFDMSEEEFQNITSLPCHYCAASAKEHSVRRKDGRSRSVYKVMSGYFANGLDRVDSDVGYKNGNVVPCCSVCNSSKSDLSYGDFLKMCNRVAIVHPARMEGTNG